MGPRVWLAAALCCAAMAVAQTPKPPRLRIPRVSRPPRLEDFLNNTPREAEARVTDFRQYEPGDGIPASQPTEAFLSYNDKNLYVVFVCRDDPARIRARMSKREDIEEDDQVIVNLDTFHDHRHAYGFFVNPLGIQRDSLWSEGEGGGDATWDTLWHSRAQLTENGYVVWIAIPFRSLRFPRAPLQDWAIELGRVIRHNSEMSTWPQTTQRIESFAQQFAALEGVENISPGRNLQVIPYFVFSRSRALDPFAAPGRFRRDTEARPGLDAKMVLRDALTLDVTVNPDFSQVESDEPQVTINQRYEVFFAEKRPFFMENASYFQTPITLFFSRRIVDPQAGARLTGKAGRWNLGILGMDDRAPGKQVAASDPLRGERAAIAVARVQREFANQSTAGVLVTSRDFAGSSNRVYSLDTRLKLNPNWLFAGQFMRSYQRQPGRGTSPGSGGFAVLSHTGRHLVYASRYRDYSPSFRTELGFVPRVDVRNMEHYLRYYWKPQRGRVLLFGPDLSSTVSWNRTGEVQEWQADLSFGGDIRPQTGLGCHYQNAYELFQRIGFRRHYTDCGINSGWLKWLQLTADYGAGTAINYTPAAPLVPFVAQQNSASFGFGLRPSPRFRLDGTYLYTRLYASARQASIFNDHILRAKANFQFTRRLSLRTIVDYHSVLPNASLVALDLNKRLTGDVLVTYLVNPGTALYVGYTDRYENLQFGALPAGLRAGAPDTSTGRQFFVKMSYLFRF